MTIARGGYGNFAGFHYSKKTCEELIREFFKREGFEIDQYNIPFKYAKIWAEYIRNESWTIEFMNKSMKLLDEDVATLTSNGYITLKKKVA